MWDSDPKSTTIEQAYSPLLSKANFDRHWSIAELKLDKKDLQWLEDWFSQVTPDKSILYRSSEKFGALLLCLGVEACREKSREDSVWPIIRKILPESHPFQSELFLSNGQPSQLTKKMICDAVRSLNLRHVMDLEGTQQWFVTIKRNLSMRMRHFHNTFSVDLPRPQLELVC